MLKLTASNFDNAMNDPGAGWKLVQFQAPGCPRCRPNHSYLTTHKEDFHQPVTLFVVEGDNQLLERFNVTTAPTMLLYGPDGKHEATTCVTGPDLITACNLLMDGYNPWKDEVTQP